MKASGIGVGLTALGGATLAAGDQHQGGDNETAAGDGMEEDAGNASGALVDDLIDPVFGYPLAADETDGVDIDTVVELYQSEEDTHGDFPKHPEKGEELPFEFFFDPVGIQVAPGDVVHFLISSGEHTVTAFHEKFSTQHREAPTRVPDGVPGFTSPPLMPDESWLYQFVEKGVYDILCLPHLPAGMVMRVVVMDPEKDSVDDEAFSEPSAGPVPPNAKAVLDADELDPSYIVDQGPVAWSDLSVSVEMPKQTPDGTPQSN